jgi:hypothetical protein
VTEPVDPTEPDHGEDVDGVDDEHVRRLLRDLPDVAPPDGFFDDLIRQRRRRARTVAVVGLAAAGVAGAIVVAQATGITGEVDPAMDDFAARHDQVLAIEATSVRADEPDLPAPYRVPEELGPMARGMAMRHPDDVVQAVYGSDGHYVSLFEQAGDLEDDAMADDLERLDLDVPGVTAWRAADDSIIVRRTDVVYVLVGEIDPDELDEVVADLPEPRPMGITSRIGDAMDDLVDAFGLG